MSTPHALLEQLHQRLAADERIEAAWLAGSFGRGDADRYSDLDLHLLPAAGDDSFRREVETWLNGARPLVLYKLLFDDRMVNALTADGVRLDIWFQDGPAVLDPAKTRLLFDRGGRLASQAAAAPLPGAGETGATAAAGETASVLRSLIEEFWRCIALTPPVIGREEWIVAWQGLQVELGLVLEIVLRGANIVRDAGAKKLNQFLPASFRAEIEDALNLPGFSRSSLVGAHLAFAALVQRHGRELAERWGFAYPAALEAAVLRYVKEELGLLGITNSAPPPP